MIPALLALSLSTAHAATPDEARAMYDVLALRRVDDAGVDASGRDTGFYRVVDGAGVPYDTRSFAEKVGDAQMLATLDARRAQARTRGLVIGGVGAALAIGGGVAVLLRRDVETDPELLDIAAQQQALSDDFRAGELDGAAYAEQFTALQQDADEIETGIRADNAGLETFGVVALSVGVGAVVVGLAQPAITRAHDAAIDRRYGGRDVDRRIEAYNTQLRQRLGLDATPLPPSAWNAPPSLRVEPLVGPGLLGVVGTF